jgi:hypothetical protein
MDFFKVENCNHPSYRTMCEIRSKMTSLRTIKKEIKKNKIKFFFIPEYVNLAIKTYHEIEILGCFIYDVTLSYYVLLSLKNIEDDLIATRQIFIDRNIYRSLIRKIDSLLIFNKL